MVEAMDTESEQAAYGGYRAADSETDIMAEA
jgi:hypothetical protein